MRPSGVPAVIAGLCFVISSISAIAQEPAPPTPAGSSGQLPPVEVIQKKATPAPAAKQKAAAKKKAVVSPAPQPFIPDEPVTADSGKPFYGAPGGAAAAARAESGPSSPINPSNGILPGNLTGFPSAGAIVTTEQIEEFRPRTVHDVFNRVPGLHVVNDDGFARHGGIGIRGSPPRRGRKVLIMEDGAPST